MTFGREREARSVTTRSGDDLHRSMVVAMILMWMVQPSVHQIADVITVRNGLVTTARAVDVSRVVPIVRRGVHRGILVVDVEPVLLHRTVLPLVMEVAVVQVVDVVVVSNPGVLALRTVLMRMMLVDVRHVATSVSDPKRTGRTCRESMVPSRFSTISETRSGVCRRARRDLAASGTVQRSPVISTPSTSSSGTGCGSGHGARRGLLTRGPPLSRSGS